MAAENVKDSEPFWHFMPLCREGMKSHNSRVPRGSWHYWLARNEARWLVACARVRVSGPAGHAIIIEAKYHDEVIRAWGDTASSLIYYIFAFDADSLTNIASDMSLMASSFIFSMKCRQSHYVVLSKCWGSIGWLTNIIARSSSRAGLSSKRRRYWHGKSILCCHRNIASSVLPPHNLAPRLEGEMLRFTRWCSI